MLREAAGYACSHGGPGWDIPQAVVRRAAEVAINQNTGEDAMLAIVADAGLEERDA